MNVFDVLLDYSNYWKHSNNQNNSTNFRIHVFDKETKRLLFFLLVFQIFFIRLFSFLCISNFNEKTEKIVLRIFRVYSNKHPFILRTFWWPNVQLWFEITVTCFRTEKNSISKTLDEYSYPALDKCFWIY